MDKRKGLKRVLVIAVFMTPVFLGAGCVAVGTVPPIDQNGKTTQDPQDVIVNVVDVGTVEIRGELVGIGFGGTEMGCDFLETDPVGKRQPCNSGVVSLGLIETGGRVIALDQVTCPGTEVLVKTEAGVVMEYEPSAESCSYVLGASYRATGELDFLPDQWRDGKQADVYVLRNAQIESL
ncbi:TPA: hypothetical protein DEB00_02440 [Candidatus Uhrbacteria bacterium]|nr:hypothetical protein [Candidatus Uhrbacteria bacterium]